MALSFLRKVLPERGPFHAVTYGKGQPAFHEDAATLEELYNIGLEWARV